MKSERGFTLIELVVVIVLLAILGAVMVPRFVNLSDEARTAKARGTVASLDSGINLTHAECLTEGAQGTMIGSMRMSDECWPAGRRPNRIRWRECKDIFDGVMDFAPSSERWRGRNFRSEWGVWGGGQFCIYIYQEDTQPWRIARYNTTDGSVDFLLF